MYVEVQHISHMNSKKRMAHSPKFNQIENLWSIWKSKVYIDRQ